MREEMYCKIRSTCTVYCRRPIYPINTYIRTYSSVVLSVGKTSKSKALISYQFDKMFHPSLTVCFRTSACITARTLALHKHIIGLPYLTGITLDPITTSWVILMLCITWLKWCVHRPADCFRRCAEDVRLFIFQTGDCKGEGKSCRGEALHFLYKLLWRRSE